MPSTCSRSRRFSFAICIRLSPCLAAAGAIQFPTPRTGPPPRRRRPLASNNAVTTRNDIFVSPIDSLVPPSPVQAERYAETSVRVSPDERLIAYVSDRTQRSEVYVRSFLSDGTEVQVPRGTSEAPDHQEIVLPLALDEERLLPWLGVDLNWGGTI